MATETKSQKADRIVRENAAVVGHFEAHTHASTLVDFESGEPKAFDREPQVIELAGQLTFFCPSCGDCRTIDTIRAEANKLAEKDE